jgi:predicted nucleic acid-binding protein
MAQYLLDTDVCIEIIIKSEPTPFFKKDKNHEVFFLYIQSIVVQYMDHENRLFSHFSES